MSVKLFETKKKEEILNDQISDLSYKNENLLKNNNFLKKQIRKAKDYIKNLKEELSNANKDKESLNLRITKLVAEAQEIKKNVISFGKEKIEEKYEEENLDEKEDVDTNNIENENVLPIVPFSNKELEKEGHKFEEEKRLKEKEMMITENWPVCDAVVGTTRAYKKGWFSILGGIICGVAKSKLANQTFKIQQTDNIYTGQGINGFEIVYKPVGKCKITHKSERLNLAGWKCPEYLKDREQFHNIMSEYIVPNNYVQGLVDTFVQNNFGKHTLGIHIRSTDRAIDRTTKKLKIYEIPSERIIVAIKRYLETNPQTDKIFIASDNKKQLQDIKNVWPDKVIYETAHRSVSKQRVHNGKDGWSKLIEVVVDSILLSKTQYLIRCYSEVSLASVIMNDKLEWDLLNSPDGAHLNNYYRNISGFKSNNYVKLSDKHIHL